MRTLFHESRGAGGQMVGSPGYRWCTEAGVRGHRPGSWNPSFLAKPGLLPREAGAAVEGEVTSGGRVTCVGLELLLGWPRRFHPRLFLVPFQSQKLSRD